MITTSDILAVLDIRQFEPALATGSAGCRRRVRFARMCIRRLPPVSALRYCIHAADHSFANRRASDRILSDEGFRTFRDLLPVLKKRFAAIWPSI